VVVVRDFDDGYRRWRSSSAHKSLFGEGLPGEIEPFSFVPMEGLRLVLNQVLRRREWGLGCGLACGCWGFGVVGLGVVPG
jgi:hypothetical protein